MEITLLSANIASPEPLAAKSRKTGIFKRPVDGFVKIGKLGLENDAIVDRKHHGGEDQAVYLYSQEDYDWWSTALGRPILPGMFGENLTVSRLESAAVLIGDRYRIGDVHLEVTSPRIPCNTLAVRMEDPYFARSFMNAKRPGVYCRVLQAGSVKAGDAVTVAPYLGASVTLLELFERFPHKSVSEEDRARYLSVPAHWKLHAFLNGEIDKP